MMHFCTTISLNYDIIQQLLPDNVPLQFTLCHVIDPWNQTGNDPTPVSDLQRGMPSNMKNAGRTSVFSVNGHEHDHSTMSSITLKRSENYCTEVGFRINATSKSQKDNKNKIPYKMFCVKVEAPTLNVHTYTYHVEVRSKPRQPRKGRTPHECTIADLRGEHRKHTGYDPMLDRHFASQLHAPKLMPREYDGLNDDNPLKIEPLPEVAVETEPLLPPKPPKCFMLPARLMLDDKDIFYLQQTLFKEDSDRKEE